MQRDLVTGLPSWVVDRYGDVVVTCPPCGVCRRFTDTVDNVAWASELWKQHANHGQEDTDE